MISLAAFLLVCSFFTRVSTQCGTDEDFGILYSGSAAFSVSKTSRVCVCPAGYSSTGSSVLQNLTVSSLVGSGAASFQAGLSFGSGSVAYPAAVPGAGQSLVGKGMAADYRVALQEAGNAARVAHYYNAFFDGTQHRSQVASEASMRLNFNDGFALDATSAASNTAAGNVITWTNLLSLTASTGAAAIGTVTGATTIRGSTITLGTPSSTISYGGYPVPTPGVILSTQPAADFSPALANPEVYYYTGESITFVVTGQPQRYRVSFRQMVQAKNGNLAFTVGLGASTSASAANWVGGAPNPHAFSIGNGFWASVSFEWITTLPVGTTTYYVQLRHYIGASNAPHLLNAAGSGRIFCNVFAVPF